MSADTWVHVELPGHGTFWVPEAALNGTDHGALAPEDHIENGRLSFPACFCSDSYAHVYPEGISRFGQKIGVRTDLRRIDGAL